MAITSPITVSAVPESCGCDQRIDRVEDHDERDEQDDRGDVSLPAASTFAGRSLEMEVAERVVADRSRRRLVADPARPAHGPPSCPLHPQWARPAIETPNCPHATARTGGCQWPFAQPPARCPFPYTRPMRPTDRRRLVILTEGQFGDHHAKTAYGVIRYGRDDVVAVLDSTQAGRNVDEFLPGHDIPIVATPRRGPGARRRRPTRS